ncbi:anthranilate synthase component 1 [Clostridium aceticum]|uniref:Anthranilate synthase component 1 n=1 Tax=Clostridium aceticum TaxID=84022 RepID=A0A0D8IEB0_9CLOT|nr:anthranilate synthase component I [Clostridium aceticum]AKL93950.1 anthranilate synthase component 1 [Clostridium aceticum]KJF28665.1 anthranilate synthase [Clostridium aceticum]
MTYPAYQQFKDLSKTYKIIPVSMEIQGDTETPITLFKKLCNTSNCYLLESVEGGEKRGRYSYIGRKPFVTMQGKDHQVTIVEGDRVYEKKGNEIEIIKQVMEDYKAPQIENMPDFIGGAVGYIGYDIVRNYEKLPHVNEDDVNLPLVHLLMAEEIIVYDHVKQKIKIIVNLSIKGDIERLYDTGVRRLKKIQEEICRQSFLMERDMTEGSSKLHYRSNETKDTFMEKVKKAKEHIRNGDIFQVVLSQRLQVKTELSPFEVYRNLRSVSPSPYLFYIDFGDYQLAGSSPELLVKVKDQLIETCPIAGTRSRGENAEEDEILAKDLLTDEKERAEHLMLVDLARNDIGKLAEFGSVEVSQYMEVCRYSHVMHIVSNVIGKLKEKYDMYDALVACLPAGTLSGAPKVRAMEIIDELENKKRGIYGGAVGYLGFNGNMDMCIAIRSILFKEKQAYLQAGAGIVADSNEEEEYKETLRKLEGLMVTMSRLEERVS